MFGLWKVTALSDADSAGAERIADVVSCMNENIEGSLYLPPYLRPNQCGIAAGSVVVGYVDNVTGKGAAFCGIDDADYGYFMDADVLFKQKVDVTKKVTCRDELEVSKAIPSMTGDVKASIGDVIAATVSLKNHTHHAELLVETSGSPTSQTGSAVGNTEIPSA